MDKTYRLLLVDDEETFRLSTADLLRLEGFDVDTAGDAEAALALMAHYQYDLFIADINMPGNHDLAFVHSISDVVPGVPVILITGYPSMQTAIKAVRMPVVAYLVKPVDMPSLTMHCEMALKATETRKAVEKAQERISQWDLALQQMKESASRQALVKEGTLLQSFLGLTMENIIGSLVDLNHLTQSLSQGEAITLPCNIKECREMNRMKVTLKETIDVLEETKHAFKSKQLFALRKHLEEVLSSLED